MNLQSLLASALHITRRNWALWVLSFITFAAFIPSAAIAGGLGGLSALLNLPASPATEALLQWLEPVRAWPAAQWVVVWVVAVVVLIVSTLITYLTQAAMMRGAALAAERGTAVSMQECLALGPTRTRRLLGLSFLVAVLITITSLLPAALRLLLGEQFGATFSWVFQAGELTLSSLLSVINLAIFLMVLAVAVEDVQTRQAPRRAWKVFKQGWWAFLLIVAGSALPAFAILLLAAPLFVVMPVVVLAPDLGIPLMLVCCCVLSPLGLGLLLFVAVFTTTLYTLVYRAAAQLADTQTGAIA